VRRHRECCLFSPQRCCQYAERPRSPHRRWLSYDLRVSRSPFAVRRSFLRVATHRRPTERLRSDLRFCLFTQLAAKRFHFALGAFIKPVMAGYNLSSLMLGSNQAPFYSPVSFVFRQCDGPATHFMSLLPRWNPACVPGQANSRAKTDQEKDSSRHTRNSGYRGLLSYCR
jgi:hypothetical protein